MLLKDSFQFSFKNNGRNVVKAGQPVLTGPRATYHEAIIGIAKTDIEPGASGVLDLTGEFSIEPNLFLTEGPFNVRQFQHIYAMHDPGTNTVTLTTTPKDMYVFFGVATKPKTKESDPLCVWLGFYNHVVNASEVASYSAPSGGGAGAMSDSSTVVEPSNSSEPGAM